MSRRLVLAYVACVAGLLSLPAAAQRGDVAGTLHNLSVSGPGPIKAESESEICKFCHVPHNPVAAAPLWGHTLSRVAAYDVPPLSRTRARAASAPQPDGASRLCLSCHDGTVALGDIGRRARVTLVGAQKLERGRRGHIGTDLSGSHPISFVLPDDDGLATDEDRGDMGLRPLASILSEGVVHVDAQNKVQCTTCHDPHSDRHYEQGRVPHFWVRPSVSEVCLACHALR